MAVYLLKIFDISTIKEEENKKTAAVLSQIILPISGLPDAHRVGEDCRNLNRVISDTGTVLHLVHIHLHL